VKTKETIDEEGWCHSGDLGTIDKDGFYYITGRIKELLITAGGENVPPAYIEENIKKELPVVSNVMVVGDKKKFLSALLTLKTEMDLNTGNPTPELTKTARTWCKSLGVEATTVDQVFNGSYEIIKKAIENGIERANKHAISNAQQIKRFKLLPEDFSIPGGELGPTLKLKRFYVETKYKEAIEEMYKE
jgi:long-chain-fatty-acid--CoA ligase ACSBG